jgi:KDO2-lipid IV(A) lauroyltransferase
MTTLFKLLSYCPLWLLHGLGWCLGWLTFLLSASYRRQFVANVGQARLRWRQWRGAVGESGKLVAELPRLWLGAPVSVTWHGTEHITQAMVRGKGLIFLTPHLGSFEITAQDYAKRFGQSLQPITVLFRPSRQAWLSALVSDARDRPGMHGAPTTLAGVKQMIKALRRGESVGLLPDQVPPIGMGVMAPFFGRDAYTMTLSVRLAQQTGATVLMVWGERLSWGRGFCVHVQPMPGDLPGDVGAAAASINRAMESLVLQCPGQYLWGYARYKTPRQTL